MNNKKSGNFHQETESPELPSDALVTFVTCFRGNQHRLRVIVPLFRNQGKGGGKNGCNPNQLSSGGIALPVRHVLHPTGVRSRKPPESKFLRVPWPLPQCQKVGYAQYVFLCIPFPITANIPHHICHLERLYKYFKPFPTLP